MPAPVRGALWMVVGAACFSLMLSTIKPVAQELHPFEIAFFRNLFAVAFMMPWLMRAGFGVLRTTKTGLFSLRALLALVSALAWYTAVPLLPLADVVAINFTAPLFGSIFAVLILREVVRLRRWSAMIIGFAGVLVILRPGFEELSTAAIILLVSNAIWGSQHIVLKVLSRTEKVNVIVCYHCLTLTPLTFIPALFVWRTPSLETLLWRRPWVGSGPSVTSASPAHSPPPTRRWCCHSILRSCRLRP